jgi:PAS domain S-box-containing protein
MEVSRQTELEALRRRVTELEAQLASSRTDRHQIEPAADVESTYQTLFDSIDEGCCILQVEFDSRQRPVDYRFLEVNRVFEQQTGLVDPVGKTARELVPNLESFWFETYGRVAMTGESMRFTQGSVPMGRLFDVYALRVGKPENRKVALLFRDITAQKRREANLDFLSRVADDFASLSGPDEILQTIGARLGEHLNIATCNFSDVHAERKALSVSYSWRRSGVPSVLRTFRIDQILSPEAQARCRAGKTILVSDAAHDPQTDGAYLASLRIGSFIAVPFRTRGEWCYLLSITDERPRDWRSDEVELYQELANRMFPRMVRARTETALRETEARLAMALDAAGGVGAWDWDIPRNRVYVNAEFARLFSLDAKRAAAGVPFEDFLPAMHPSDRESVVARVGQAQAKGEEYSLEYRVVQPDGESRWIHARGRGYLDAEGAPSRFNGLVFDITERKNIEQRDAFLVRLDDAVRPLTDPQEIMQTTAKILGEHMEVSRCAYADVEEDEDTCNLNGDYTNGVPSIVGRFSFRAFGEDAAAAMRAGEPFVVENTETDPRTRDTLEAYRAIQIGSVLCVPLRKNGAFVAGLALHHKTPRRWGKAEIELVRLVTNRCWESIERAKVTRNMLQSRERLRAIVDGTYEYIGLLTPEGTVLEANRASLEFAGNRREDVLGRFFWETDLFVHTEGAAETVRQAVTRAAAGELVRYEAALNQPLGRSLTFDLSLHPIRDEQGKVILIVPEARDITERKQAEAELKQQWKTFDTALSHTPDLTFIFDRQGRLQYANRALLEVWQLALDDVLGKTLYDLSYPKDLADHVHGQANQVIETRQVVRDVTPYTGALGETRVYEYLLAPVIDGGGRVEAVTGSTRDITEREQIERALTESKEKLQQVFRQAPVAIVVLRGRDLVVELANPSYHKLMRNRVMEGRPIVDVVPELTPEIIESYLRVLDTGEPFVGNEVAFPYDQDGDGVIEDHWFNVVYNPFRGTGSDVDGLIIVATEVTAQVLARRELERVNRELEQFVYAASHDLQEPLRMVNIYTALLLKRFAAGAEPAQQYAAYIEEGVSRMESLLRDLLSYARSAQRDDAPAGTADLAAAYEEAIFVLQNRIQETGAIIESSPLPKVRGETAQLAHVFQNLLSNAIKYRKSDQAPEIRINAVRNGSFWTISVEDKGIGFEQEYATRIFGLFKRLHKDEYPGTGLGLAICLRIIERSGGSIWAESVPGKGSTFFFTLHSADED